MYVCVSGIKEPKEAYKFFHSDEQKEFSDDKFFTSNGKVFFEVNDIDSLIAAQDALEERVKKNTIGGYYINITNS